MMVGRDVQLVVDKAPADARRAGPRRRRPGRQRRSGPRGWSTGCRFEVRAGEILAIAGVQGNGQTELIEAITGLRHAESGTVRLDGRDVTGWPPDRPVPGRRWPTCPRTASATA